MKKIDVLLIVPTSSTFRMAEEHLGVAYLAASLSKFGIGVKVVDAFLFGINYTNLEKLIIKYKPSLIGFSLYSDSIASFARLTVFIKKNLPNCHITIGGYFSSLNVDLIVGNFAKLVDSIVVGEGEESLINLYNYLNGKKDIDLSGIVMLDSIKNKIYLPRAKITDLDSLPFPSRYGIKRTMKLKNPVHIGSSRGCYGNCSFCAISSFSYLNVGEKWRGRSVPNVVDEIQQLYKVYKVRYFKFVDDCWFPHGADWEKRAIDFCNELKKRKLKIKFRFSVRVDNVKYNVFKLLKENGLFSASIGVESCVKRQIEEWRKGVSVVQNAKALGVCQKLGIIVQMGYIMFDGKSTLEELKAHYIFLNKFKSVITKSILSMLFVAKGTPIAEKYKKDSLITDSKTSLSINLDYCFKDKKVENIFLGLKLWVNVYGQTYTWAIDTLSSPRAISPARQMVVKKIIMSLKEKELFLFKNLIKKAAVEKNEMIDYVEKEIENNKVFMASVEKKLRGFYKKNGLSYESRENIFVK